MKRLHGKGGSSMNGTDARRSKGIRITLSAKILIMFVIIIVVMLIPVFSLVRSSNSYIDSYAQVLSNIEKIDYIKGTTDTQPRRILNYCLVGKEIGTSGEGEEIACMLQYISDIIYDIGENENYAQNMAQAVVVKNLLENYLQNYREGIGLCSGRFSLAGDSKFYLMNDIAGYISKNCSSLLNLEMQRSADIQKQIVEDYNQMKTTAYFLLSGTILVAIGLIFSLQKSVAKPVRLLSDKLTVIADRDLTDTALSVRSRDEIGDMANAYNVMKANLKEILEKVSSVSRDIESSCREVTKNVEDTADGSEHISKTVEFMMEKIERQNEESRMVMSNIDEISGISRQIHSNAESIQISARTSIDGANQGTRILRDYTAQLEVVNSVMQGITRMVNDLQSSTQRMNDIVNTISEISDETNLLSLNASIEAARAGEAGRGFAVVAGQIQRLADNSKNSAAEIGDIISDVQSRTANMTEEMQQGLLQLEKGNTIAEATRKSFGQIEQSINEVNDQIQEIVVNVNQLFSIVVGTTHNMDVIKTAMQDTSEVTKSIEDTVNLETSNLEELTATMTLLSESASGLKETLAQFRL